MTLILNIETSTKACSVSLGVDGKLIALKEESSDKYIHSEKLNLFIEDVFTQTDFTLKDLDAICVTKGPGSYTGLRIGVSSAKGLCYALEIPLISMDSLSVLANSVIENNSIEEGTLLTPMIDARRMEVYTATFDSKGKMKSPISAEVIDADTFDNNQKRLLFGDGAEKCKEVLENSNIEFIEQFSTAKGMVKISYTKFKANEFEDVAYFEPFYLKDFQAG